MRSFQMMRRIIFVSLTLLALALLSNVLITSAVGRVQSDCVLPLESGSVTGTWDSSCLSTRPAPLVGGDRYARFYTFTLDSETSLVVSLSSTEDTYLYVRRGHGTSGAVAYSNDDRDNVGDTNSAVSETFQPGDFTIEATTYRPETTGEFLLTVSGLPEPAGTPLPTPDTPEPGTPGPTPEPGTPEPSPEPGTPEPVPTESPTTVPTPSEEPAASELVGASHHACALFSSGTIDCWGDDGYGEVSGHPSSGGYIALSLDRNIPAP